MLSRSLGPWMLWGLGVGYVISGMYFGWNLGLEQGGTLGLAIATAWITVMYVAFTLSYAELTCAMPRAGGVFVYATRAGGGTFGIVGGLAQIVEFVFAPPAIAAAIGAYLNLFFPHIPALVFAMAAYVAFTGINIVGVRLAAGFELFVTIAAVLELLLFASITLPHVSWAQLSANPLPHGIYGIFAAVPFAIWFFLAIEGLANVAEEAIDPQRNIVRGFSLAMATLVFLCVLVFVASVGVAGWEAVVYPSVGAEASDSPLPLALSHIIGKASPLYHLLVVIGVFGLVASFHGIILAAGRATFEFGRAGLAPRALGTLLPKRNTPAFALLANMAVGICALLTGKTGDLIIVSCFGALTLYIVSMISLLLLRRHEPHLTRPFKTPWYPLPPILALVISIVASASIAYSYPRLTLGYGFAMGLLTWFLSRREEKIKAHSGGSYEQVCRWLRDSDQENRSQCVQENG